MKAKSEAEIEALRSELESMKQATSTVETALHDDRCGDVDRNAPAPEASVPPDSIVADSKADDTVAGDDTATSDDTAGDDIAPKLRVPDEDRPERAHLEIDPIAESNLLRFLPPARIAFLAVVAIVALVSYFVTTSIIDNRDGRTVVASDAGPIAGEGVLHDTGTDAKSIAAASASLDAELARMQVLSRKVAALRTALAVRRNTTPTRMAAADRAPSASGANWLLYMPVERPALVQYLAGRSWPGIQMAVQPGESPVLQR